MERMTRNSDDRGPNGQGADANSFTRAQFLRTLVKGAGGVIAADAGLGGLLMPSRAKGALYADGTTNAQTLSRGYSFRGRLFHFGFTRRGILEPHQARRMSPLRFSIVDTR